MSEHLSNMQFQILVRIVMGMVILIALLFLKFNQKAPELTESTIITSFENFTIAKSTFFYEDRPPTYTYRILNYNLTIEENLSDKNK